MCAGTQIYNSQLPVCVCVCVRVYVCVHVPCVHVADHAFVCTCTQTYNLQLPLSHITDTPNFPAALLPRLQALWARVEGQPRPVPVKPMPAYPANMAHFNHIPFHVMIMMMNDMDGHWADDMDDDWE